jgi:lycopene beta-cyclase
MTLPASRYDIVFLGGGAATLSLLMRLVRSGSCAGQRFLVIDSSDKKANDRTWCYWEKGAGYFEEVVHRKWSGLAVKNLGVELHLSFDSGLDGYEYKMIRGQDFYNYCHRELEKSGQVDFFQATILDASFDSKQLRLVLTGFAEPVLIATELVFNSIAPDLSVLGSQKKGFINILQHFKGITIESSELNFDTSRATLMDFRTPQTHGTSFFYVMPLARNKALVEYTLFTPSLLTQQEYDLGLKKYIGEQLGVSNYQVVEEEFGVIPMTNYPFKLYDRGLFNIGTAGGQTKGSSGYTFRFIQKRSDEIARILCSESKGSDVVKKLQALSKTPARFHFYDNVLLNVLWHHYHPGDQVFTRLFQRNKASQVFRFLDNETSLPEEIRIISSLPTGPFLKAALHSMG